LPARASDEAAAISERDARAESAPHRGTILIIDDDKAVHDLLEREFVGEGYRVLHAAGGREGLQIAKKARPDMITLDIIMPDLDGWTVLRALKADPELHEIPVLLVTIMGDRDMGFALGAADYITKPFDRKVLVQAVSRHLRGNGQGQILVVDDDWKTRDMLRRTLEKEGWMVDEATDGREADEPDRKHGAGPRPARFDYAKDGRLRSARADAARGSLARHSRDRRDRQGFDTPGDRPAQRPCRQDSKKGRLSAKGSARRDPPVRPEPS
jgi:DNA-binding response OmpR family regulator